MPKPNKPTPGPWLKGHWTILKEDRGAQKRGEPYWTFEENDFGNDYAHGPYGRKEKSPDRIIDGVGYEHEGVMFLEPEDEALFLAAPDLLAALKRASCQFVITNDPGSVFYQCQLAINKAEGRK